MHPQTMQGCTPYRLATKLSSPPRLHLQEGRHGLEGTCNRQAYLQGVPRVRQPEHEV